jgi:hypothetical protein
VSRPTGMRNDLEELACLPQPVDQTAFNHTAKLPYGLRVDHVRLAMESFVNFLYFINTSLHSNSLPRMESLLMPANFSSIVGEFMKSNIPKFCPSIVANRYHNGHPDLIPAGYFDNDAVQHGRDGVEIKASRYDGGWQGHNPEDTWLMVFVFSSNRPGDPDQGVPPKPFCFLSVYCALLEKADWSFSGRSADSRRTITASVTRSGRQKMLANWIYRIG